MGEAQARTDRLARCIVPTIRTSLVGRPKVDELLGAANGKTVLVCAPAGYGKTSHVAEWASAQGRPVAWADLEPGDNDPAILLGLLAGLLHRVTDIGGEPLPGAGLPPQELATRAGPVLASRLGRCSRPFVLVLDEVQVLHDPAATAIVDLVLRNVPADSTIVLAGRSLPAVPLARLRARDAVVDVSIEALTLDEPAAAELLVQVGVRASETEIHELVEQTEGWPVGIQLLGPALHDEEGAEHRSSPLHSVPPRAICDYLAEEWTVDLTPADRLFLLEVSGLDRLDPRLCDRVTGRADSADVLHRIHSRHLLVIPLARRSDSYRLHPLLGAVLFSEFDRTDPDTRRDVDRRASRWFEGAGEIDQAIRHALRSGDLERAEHLVCDHAVQFRTKGQHHTVRRWLDSFPQDHVLGRPALCLIAALTALGFGEVDQTVAWLGLADHALETSPDGEVTALEVAAVRAVLAPDGGPYGIEEAARAWRHLPPGIWHAAAGWSLGGLSMANGDVTTASDALTRAALEAKQLGTVTVEAQCRAALAALHATKDDLAASASEAREALRLIRSHGLEEFPTLVLVTAVNALIDALDGDGESALRLADLTSQNLDFVERASPWTIVQVRLSLARTYLVLGDLGEAARFLAQVDRYLAATPGATGVRRQHERLTATMRTSQTVLPLGPSALSPAEIRVLEYLPTNLSLADIASRLYVARNTTKSHTRAIYSKLGVQSRTEAVDTARALGLLGDAQPVGPKS